jgi:hemoglobin-like flavoprotein
MACDLRCHTRKGNSMTPEHVDLVQRSWRAVLPVGDTAAELFYGKLFSLDPSIQKLFRQDLREQGRNLTSMLSVAVGSLSRPQKITLAVQQLGRRHAAYGVEPRHYELVGIALLWMLDQVLGEAFTPQVREAWTEVYRLLASTMQDACAVH